MMMPATKINTVPQFVCLSMVEREKYTQLLNEWQQWAEQAPPGCGEFRDMAVLRLKDCLVRACPWLDLSDLQLTALPALLPDFLRELDISKNSLRRVPENLPDTIKVLQISHNRLKMLPNRLPASLNRLYASHNKLTQIPENLPGSVKVLDISYNRLVTLPNKLPSLLYGLYAHHNRLTQVPENLPASTAILEIGHNLLTSLPGQLPASLDVLYVNDNLLSQLPPNLPHLIRVLDASYNQLTTLPDRLPDTLNILCAGHNQLTRLPEHLPVLLKTLDIKYNQVVSLPDQLPSLSVLYASKNQITALPDRLPDSLNTLIINDNCLMALPARLPSCLRKLNISCNQLVSLPERLPTSLAAIYASHNRLTGLPENLPGFLECLDVSHNQLTRLPVAMPNTLDTLNVGDNPLLDSSILVAANQSTAVSASSTLFGFLINIRYWDEDIDTKKWESIYTENHAGVFADFLYKLHQGKNSTNHALRKQIANWLTYLVDDAHRELREQTFSLADEAAASCVDRASFYFNHMHILMVEHQFLDSNAPLTQVVEAIRGAFRLQVLEGIAAEKVAARRQIAPGFAEDLEIYLAYQCKLRESFALPVYTELQFEQIAAITDDDICQAQERMIEIEKTHFGRYWLTESALWTAKLEKWNADKKAAIDSEYLEAISSAKFNETVNKALQEKGISINDIDAHRDLSKAMAEDLFYQYRYQLTQEFFAAHQALPLLCQISSPSLQRG